MRLESPGLWFLPGILEELQEPLSLVEERSSLFAGC